MSSSGVKFNKYYQDYTLSHMMKAKGWILDHGIDFYDSSLLIVEYNTHYLVIGYLRVEKDPRYVEVNITFPFVDDYSREKFADTIHLKSKAALICENYSKVPRDDYTRDLDDIEALINERNELYPFRS